MKRPLCGRTDVAVNPETNRLYTHTRPPEDSDESVFYIGRYGHRLPTYKRTVDV